MPNGIRGKQNENKQKTDNTQIVDNQLFYNLNM